VTGLGATLKLLAFVLPLGLDSFAVAAAIGASTRVSRAGRLRLSVIFVVFEAGMPLLGLALGRGLARGAGAVAGYLAAAAVVGIGVWMLASGDDAEEGKAAGLAAGRGLAVIGLGVSISLDELAIGFSAGLIRLPLLALIIAIGVQTLVVAQAGLILGAKISERLREGAERMAGIALIGLGAFLLTEQILR
jgi:putative Mn2+ efflux pump MntP